MPMKLRVLAWWINLNYKIPFLVANLYLPKENYVSTLTKRQYKPGISQKSDVFDFPYL